MRDVFCKEELKNSRIQRRVNELLAKAANSGPSHPSSGQRELHFVFFRKPDRFLESQEKIGYVSGVRLEKTVLQGIYPVLTNKTCDIIVSLILRSACCGAI